jgi:hypothetical protein
MAPYPRRGASAEDSVAGMAKHLSVLVSHSCLDHLKWHYVLLLLSRRTEEKAKCLCLHHHHQHVA